MHVRRAVAGGAAGTLATVAMSAWQAAGQLTGPYGEQPPKRLVRAAAHKLGLPARRHGPLTWPITAAAHLGFGAACGGLYAIVLPRSTLTRGTAFGLAVWAASYAGWIPAVGVLPPPHRDNPRRAIVTRLLLILDNSSWYWSRITHTARRLVLRRTSRNPLGTNASA